LVWGPQMINHYHRPYKWGLSSMTPTRKDSWLWVPQVRNLYNSILPQLQHYSNTTTDLPSHYDNTTTVVLNNFDTLLLQWDYSSITTRLLHYHDTADEESFWWGHLRNLYYGPHKEGFSTMGPTHKGSSVWVPPVRFLSDVMIPQLHYCWVENPYLWGPWSRFLLSGLHNKESFWVVS
jgi:hypothetical protein